MIHIANTNIELEFASSPEISLERGIAKNPLCLQLQYLPLLYAQPTDLVAVTALPDDEELHRIERLLGSKLPALALLNEHSPFQGKNCLSWGASRQVQAWAHPRGVGYEIPEWEVVQQINSKAFSFRYTTLPQAALLTNENELNAWVFKVAGPKVLKTCFGLAGQGHCHIERDLLSPSVFTYCHREWEKRRPVIGEPWLERIEDFSTQWEIDRDGTVAYIGATRFEADEKGVYRGTSAGPQDILFSKTEKFLQQHLDYVQGVLRDSAGAGFFGPLGFDAFLYRDPIDREIRLNPLVEINARWTMSRVALSLQQKISPGELLHLAFDRADDGALPSFLPSRCRDGKGKEVVFRRKLSALGA